MGSTAKVLGSVDLTKGGVEKNLLLPAVLMVGVLLCLPSPGVAFEKVKIGDAIPAFSLQDTTGGTVSSGDFVGKAAVVVFFRKGPSTAKALKRIERSFQASKEKAVGYYGIYLGKEGSDGAKALAEEGEPPSPFSSAPRRSTPPSGSRPSPSRPSSTRAGSWSTR